MKKLLLLLTFLVLILNLSGCFVSEEDSGDEFKLTCKIDGVSRTFYAGGFGLDSYDSTYNNFYADKNNEDEYVYLRFPHPVSTSTSYTKAVADFKFSYRDAAGVSYSSEYGAADLVLNVTEWGTNDGDWTDPLKLE